MMNFPDNNEHNIGQILSDLKTRQDSRSQPKPVQVYANREDIKETRDSIEEIIFWIDETVFSKPNEAPQEVRNLKYRLSKIHQRLSSVLHENSETYHAENVKG